METTGNFLTQPNKDFPLDCETLEMLQNNASLVAALGNIAGDKLILSGCETSAGGGNRSAGLVFVRTRAYPDGEVLRWMGGDTTGGMYVETKDIAISALGVHYPKAYTRRTLMPGVGEESYRWEDFKKPKTRGELEKQISDLETKLAAVESRAQGEPLGVVKMWAGVKVPEGYALCDGAALRASEYPELYAALGTTFNNAVNYNGSANTTQSGFFRLPDLRGRFVVGYSDVDNDYKKYGNAGGEKKHTLNVEEMPSHSHGLKFTSNKWGDDANRRPFPDTNGTDVYTASTGNTGGDAAHENRPPYYVLAYIIKVS